ncbi:MAG: XRE family transcriptional regulator [Rhodospirillaceae bacterium]|nr:MAG: XRE family transcriptional regulator [Rhodospirillaceae bacterium]
MADPSPPITPEQSRAARALLDWSQERLAEKAELSGGSVRHFEKGRQPLSPNNLAAVRAALEKAGVEFIAENGGGAGVRLAKRSKGKARK